MRYHLTPVRMAKINKSGNDRCWRGCGERGTFLHCWWECTVGAITLENSMEVPQKVENRATLWPSNTTLLGIYPKDTNVVIWRGMCTQMFIAAMCTIAKLWEEPRCSSTDEWVKKVWYIYTMEYYAAIKRNEILPFVTTWMELEHIMLSEISQSEKDNYHMISLIWGSGDATWGLWG